MAADLVQLETKLAAARTRLILEKPFLGALVMHLPLKASNPKWCETTATDAKAFYYNPAYIARLTLEQTQFVLAHEAMHCALSHFNRRGHRLKHRWDVACDYAVNMILDEDRMQPPDEALMNAAYRGLTAEEIYPVLHEDPPEKTQDMHLFDSDSPDGEEGEPQEQDSNQGEGDQRNEDPADGQGGPPEDQQEDQQDSGNEPQESGETQEAPPPPPMDTDKLDEQWKSRLAAAAQAARQAGKLSQSMMRLVDDLLSPQMPWRALLARYMMNAARDDYSFQRTSRREGEALMPRLYSQSVKVVVAMDTSGSVTREELQEFLSEIDALKAQVRADVTLHACDDKVDPSGPWRYAMWEAMTLPEEISGGGGTDFRPVFDWVEQDRISPDLLVYFTDAQGRFPEREPPYPVIWLVKGKSRVPFGDRIQLN
jgi:predicted metal-dependent peptidase